MPGTTCAHQGSGGPGAVRGFSGKPLRLFCPSRRFCAFVALSRISHCCAGVIGLLHAGHCHSVDVWDAGNPGWHSAMPRYEQLFNSL